MHDVDQVAEIAAETVELPNDKCVAIAKSLEAHDTRPGRSSSLPLAVSL